MTEDKMVGWHHRLDGYELEQALGVGDGQGSLACCSLWGGKEQDVTWQQNNHHHQEDITTLNVSCTKQQSLKCKKQRLLRDEMRRPV